MKHSSRRTKSVLQRRENLWTDSSSENDEKKVKFETFDTSNDESPSPCCLICSILPNLSNINTCPKHLQLVHRSPVRPPQVVYMMHPPIRHCRCSRKPKHRCRSISSSSSSSESEYRHQRKKRSMTIESSSSNESSQNEQFFSPILQSQTRSERMNNIQLSPSLPPSTTIQLNRSYPELLLPTVLHANNSTMELPGETSMDVLEIEAISSSSPEISLDQIVHVKDENESSFDHEHIESLMNMSQATEQMYHHQYPQPIILLERVSLDNY